MVRFGTWLAFVLPLASCYFDRINRPPEAKIGGPTETFQRDPLTFRSMSGDPDGDAVTYAWTARRCPSENQCAETLATSSAADLSFDAPAAKGELVIVTLVVTDVSGARDEDRRVVPIRNRLPAITKLQVESQTNNLGGYTVGRLLQIRAEFHDEDPGDTLTARWMHYPAPDSPPGSQPFTVISDTSATLRPNAIGEWIVELTVDDGTPGGEGVATEDLSIRVDPDLDPCLGPLSPPPASSDAPILVARELGPRVFRVASVIDDLDPYPYEVGSPDADLGRPAFRWFLGRGAGPLGEVPGSDQADYTLRPDAFAPGEELTLRVEVQDRVPGWPACPIDEATCASEVPACLQRATWKVVVR